MTRRLVVLRLAVRCRTREVVPVFVELEVAVPRLMPDLARCEIAVFRHRVLHVAAQLVRSSRQLHLRLDQHWCWATNITSDFDALSTASPEPRTRPPTQPRTQNPVTGTTAGPAACPRDDPPNQRPPDADDRST